MARAAATTPASTVTGGYSPQHALPMLLAQLAGNARRRQLHELSERRVRQAGMAGRDLKCIPANPTHNPDPCGQYQARQIYNWEVRFQPEKKLVQHH